MEYFYPVCVNWCEVLNDLRCKGISGYSLAELMQVSRSTVQRWEEGSEPGHSFGMAILNIHSRFCGQEYTHQRITEAKIKH